MWTAYLSEILGPHALAGLSRDLARIEGKSVIGSFVAVVPRSRPPAYPLEVRTSAGQVRVEVGGAPLSEQASTDFLHLCALSAHECYATILYYNTIL